MKLKDLTNEDLDYIKSVYLDKNQTWDERMNLLVDYFGKSERTVRKWLVSLGFKEKTDFESEEYIKAKGRKFDKNKKRFLITWAQNATPVHDNFFKNLQAYAKHINASIHVIAGRYKNPTSVFEDREHENWDEKVVPFLDANRHDIHKYLSILSDIKIQPTTTNPLSGMSGISGVNSCIIGHPRVHMEVLPTIDGLIPKIMLTTGACTVSNYTDSKSGAKGEFHHTLGCVVVEIKDQDIFYTRQITATDDGDFIDLFYEVKKGKITNAKNPNAIVLGDLHLGETDEVVMKTTEDILNILKPKYCVIHDLVDGYSVSHHTSKNPIKLYENEIKGRNSLRDELKQMVAWVKKMEKYNLVIVRSNHDDFIDRWIINSDWKQNIKNSMEYVEYAKVLLNGSAPKGIVPYIIDNLFKNVKTLGRRDSFIVGDWELGQHGDFGKGGSRGSLEQFRNLNTKIVVGHYHTPGRKDGALAVGTSTRLKLEYNLGLNSWLNSHVVINSNNKAQHLNIINGGYTTLK